MTKRTTVIAFIAVAMLLLFAVLFMPDLAFADANPASSSKSIGFANILGRLRTLVTVLLLPLAVVLSAWKIIYIVLVGGIMGMDPLNMITDRDRSGDISWNEITIQLRGYFVGFGKGLLWIGGIFIVFNLAMSVAAMIAENFANAVG